MEQQGRVQKAHPREVEGEITLPTKVEKAHSGNPHNNRKGTSKAMVKRQWRKSIKRVV
jgi:hypothetical protein